MSLLTSPYGIHIHDTYRNYLQLWIDREDKRALTQSLPSKELRTKVMEQLRQISCFLPLAIQKKYYSYKQHSSNPVMQNRASMFAKGYMDLLLIESQKIQATVAKVQKHWEKFETCLAIGGGLKLIQDMDQANQQIEQDLANVTTQCTLLKQKIEEHVEDKWQQNVEKEVHSFYARFINAFRSLRNMEKGMISCLEKAYDVPDRFKHDLRTYIGSIRLNNFRAPISKNPSAEPAITHLLCPFTQKLFKQPVIIETGHSFEKGELTDLLTHCPLTKKKLTFQSFIPNLAIESIAQRLAASKTQDTFFERMPAFASPISGRLFQKPVVVSSGITYEESEADALFAQNNLCPVMGVPLIPSIKIPNLALKELMEVVQEKE